MNIADVALAAAAYGPWVDVFVTASQVPVNIGNLALETYSVLCRANSMLYVTLTYVRPSDPL
jgi:hypothetical protein